METTQRTSNLCNRIINRPQKSYETVPLKPMPHVAITNYIVNLLCKYTGPVQNKIYCRGAGGHPKLLLHSTAARGVKGTVSRDFRPLGFFFIKQSPLGP
jgi:hypothetical protein